MTKDGPGPGESIPANRIENHIYVSSDVFELLRPVVDRLIST
jgi:hypothetical protein